MGCCFSGGDDTDNQRAVSERDPLLGGSSAPIANGQRPVDDIHNSSAGPISKTDEQSLLSRILHQTAHNVIDVSATEPHSIERTEYMERSRQYMSKLSSVNNSAPYNNADLPAGVKNPQVALASDPIPAGDIAFIIHAAKGAHSSLSAFHVKPREALVVQFESS
ncbi:PREDICTED: ragulator complex protein LAMTOR1-like [Acropora digitifera]|uniref:ragulator complex protein LAMTOR1-like n=1 Tax=Acropora digitifera TaxID=70779 RepID=UPI00077AD456|nr:PREDICTED: ragulator complex protein LAMTOR1-like [Acropora digitifera]XP_029204760.1 ragulator complex protein LAMTOR1-like [Acropora millepora]